jgi:hypothetical protein
LLLRWRSRPTSLDVLGAVDVVGILADPAAGRFADRLQIDGAHAELPDTLLLQDAGLGQDLAVVTHERHADAERLGQAGSAHGAVASQKVDHVDPPRVGQRLEDAGALLGGHAAAGHSFPECKRAGVGAQ